MRACLNIIPADIKRVYVAYSGGLDSSVLLHLVVSAKRSYQIIPWHINHGLLEQAEQMESFCRDQAKAHGLEFRLDRLALQDLDSNLEAEARHRRYQLFARRCQPGDCVLTAHHADDQAETFLLNALRGAGSAGLRGIAGQRKLAAGLLLRPLLAFDRQQLEAYAAEHEIAWFNDPSNQNLRFDRNYLRNQVIPLIRKRWPAFQQALAGSSRIQAETQQLLEDLATVDLLKCQGPASSGFPTLCLPALLQLSPGRRKNLLRHWIDSSGFKPLPQTRLAELLKQLQATSSASPKIAMPDYALRIYDQRLFLVAAGTTEDLQAAYDFGLEQEIEIRQLSLQTTRAAIFMQLQLEDQAQQLSLRFRREMARSQDRHRLKRLFQKHRVPPWQRPYTAQIYLDDQLLGLLHE